MRYAVAVVVILGALAVISTQAVDAATQQSSPHRQSPPPQSTTHDVAVNYAIVVGPAAINLSDTNGRYMWVLSALRNNSGHAESVEIDISVEGQLPDGCERDQSLVLPGQTRLLMAAGEVKTVIARERYQCHAPATLQTLSQAVTVRLEHCGDATPTPSPGPTPEPDLGEPGDEAAADLCPNDGGAETNLANNAATSSKQILIQ